MKIEKLMRQEQELDGEQLIIFQICVDDCYFGPNRFFEGPIVKDVGSGVDGRFVVLTERRMSSDKPTGESRLVVLDRELKNQWVTAWVSWGNFTEIKLVENRNSGSLLANVWSWLKERINIAGYLRFQVAWPHRTDSYRASFFLLPFPCRDCVPWSNRTVPTKVDSRWTRRAVSFDALRLRVTEDPGPVVSEEYWRDITQISIERKVDDRHQWTDLKIWGRGYHSLSIPCRGAGKFTIELSSRYAIPPEKIRQVVDSGVSRTELLWSTLNPETDFIGVHEVGEFSQDEFRDGFALLGGGWVSWRDTIDDLVTKGAIRLDNSRSLPVYETTSPVQLGRWVLPRLWTYPGNLQSTGWIPKDWHLEFLDFEPGLTTDQLDRCLRGLSEGQEFSFCPAGCQYFITGRNVCFSIEYYYGIWRLKVELAFDKYWEQMRRRHPMTNGLDVSKFEFFDAVSMDGGMGRFDVSRFKGAELIPTPESLARFPLAFWEDQKNGWQGIASHVTAHYWRKGELTGLEVHTTSYPSGRGYDWEESVLTVRFKTRGHLRAFFLGTLTIPTSQVLEWML